MTTYHTVPFGWIYCIVHPREPEHIKIGMTSRSIESRLRSANTFSTQSFQIVQARYVETPYRVEQLLHQIFEPYRVADNREFFRSECLPYVMSAFDLVPGVIHPNSKHFSVYRYDLRVRFFEFGVDSFEELFFSHFKQTGKLSDRVRFDTIRATLIQHGLPEDTDVFEELLRLEILPEQDFYIGLMSTALQSIESFAHVPEPDRL
jgi:hypothetical protein